jgi:hypothetical protein
MHVDEAERYTHAPASPPVARMEGELETFLCGANVGKLVAFGRPTCPRCLVRTMTLKDAQTELSNRVYEAARLLEELEYAGKVFGNGHHMRQQLCAAAEALLAERWTDPLPPKRECGCPDLGPEYEKHHPHCHLA